MYQKWIHLNKWITENQSDISPIRIILKFIMEKNFMIYFI